MSERQPSDFGAQIIRPEKFTRVESYAPGPPGLKGGDGGSTFDGMPPDFPERVAKLETHVEHMANSISRLDRTVEAIRTRMDTDFRLTWGGMIVATLGLAALMAKGFHWI